jgi:hypothetical protein
MQELAVAIAGPMVNVGTIQSDSLAHIDDPRVSLLARLAAVNVFLFLT